MNYENEIEIDLGKCLRALVRKWWFMVALAVLFGIAGFILTLGDKKDVYEAKSGVYAVATDSTGNTQLGVTAINSYSDRITSMKVCERAALMMGDKNITGADIQDATSIITSNSSTSTSSSALADKAAALKIKCESDNPVTAMEMANAVAESFVIEIRNILGEDCIKVLDKPSSYDVVFNANQNKWMIRIVAFLAGGVLAAAIIVLGEIFDSKARTIRECTLGDKLPIIGVIPMMKN